MTSISWPPPYSIKKHPRARHVKLITTQRHGLQIITPSRFNQKNIPVILEENRAWIEKKLLQLWQEAQEKQTTALPVEIEFKAIKQTWRVCYLKTSSPNVRLMTRPLNEVVLFGDTENLDVCEKLLSQWVKKQADKHLSVLLKKVSDEIGLTFNKVSVRRQQSRWGSCSQDKNISLNYKLLFLPWHLVRHILVHELCHTVYLDHSERFWDLVASFDDQWEENNRAMRKGDSLIPLWVL